MVIFESNRIIFLKIVEGPYDGLNAGVDIETIKPNHNYYDRPILLERNIPDNLKVNFRYVGPEMFNGFTPLIETQWVYDYLDPDEPYQDVMDNKLTPTKEHPFHAHDLNDAHRLLNEHLERHGGGSIEELPLTPHGEEIIKQLKILECLNWNIEKVLNLYLMI